jgi:hypothetical protein
LLAAWPRLAGIAVLGLGIGVTALAQPLILTPGARTTIPIQSTTSDCETYQQGNASKVVFWFPITTCLDDPLADTPLRVLAASGFSSQFSFFPGGFSSIQNIGATATLRRKIQIPEPLEEPFLSTLRVQIATEAAWSGGFVAAGANNSYAQIVATLQLRDVTDGPDGPVVASDTFFRERFDARFDLAFDISLGGIVEALNLVDAVDVSNSSGADITAYLRRGRTYVIELETRCEVGAPVFGFAFCLFAGNAGSELGIPSDNPLAVVFADDGFQVAPLEVIVDSDPVEDAIRSF